MQAQTKPSSDSSPAPRQKPPKCITCKLSRLTDNGLKKIPNLSPDEAESAIKLVRRFLHTPYPDLFPCGEHPSQHDFHYLLLALGITWHGAKVPGSPAAQARV